MMDQTQIDLLHLINTSLKKVAATGGGEYHGPCPFCGGKDRFIVQPAQQRWSCRQCSPRWSDAIEYVKRRDRLDFGAAIRQLGLTSERKSRRRLDLTLAPETSGRINTSYGAETADWQQCAQAFVQDCFHNLFAQSGQSALDYLLQRHLTRPAISGALLGYNPTSKRAKWGDCDVYLPRGIVIPWFDAGRLTGVRIRLPEGGYKWVTGSRGKALYRGGHIMPDCRVILVESELDALLLQGIERYCDLNYIPVATGGTSGARALRYVALLNMASQVWVAFDNDANGAGDKGAEWWLKRLPRARRLTPMEKDIGDMAAAGVDLLGWLEQLCGD